MSQEIVGRLAGAVAEGAALVDVDTGDATLDDEFRRELNKASALLAGFIGEEGMARLGFEGRRVHTCAGQPVGRIRAARAACEACQAEEAL